MPLQNRVNPFGQLVSNEAHGAWMGNRGRLHNQNKIITKPFAIKAWIVCQLHYQDIKRTIFSPSSYSELFFLDEATAYASGHRPCGECRKQRLNEFKYYWSLALNTTTSVAAMDEILHGERINQQHEKVTYQAKFKDLPDGTFIEYQGDAYLIWQGQLWQWSFIGYSNARKIRPKLHTVKVITPFSIVKLFSKGLKPQVHISAYN